MGERQTKRAMAERAIRQAAMIFKPSRMSGIGVKVTRAGRDDAVPRPSGEAVRKTIPHCWYDRRSDRYRRPCD